MSAVKGKNRIRGHLGELIQGRLGPSGPVALITLPCDGLWVEAEFSGAEFSLHCDGPPVIGPERLRRIFNELGLPPSGGWRFTSNMPIAAGAGSSTAAILSALRLIAPNLDRRALETLCLRIEGASDPLLSPAPERELWAPRQAEILARLPAPPRLLVVGGFMKGVRQTDASDEQFPDIAPLVADWPAACQDPAKLGRLVTCSSLLTAGLRGEFDGSMLPELLVRFGAYGVSIAHTGTGCALLLPPSRDAIRITQDLTALGFSHIQAFFIGETR